MPRNMEIGLFPTLGFRFCHYIWILFRCIHISHQSLRRPNIGCAWNRGENGHTLHRHFFPVSLIPFTCFSICALPGRVLRWASSSWVSNGRSTTCNSFRSDIAVDFQCTDSLNRSLLGGPLAGSLLTKNQGSYSVVIIFSGTTLIAGSFLILCAKFAIDRRVLVKV